MKSPVPVRDGSPIVTVGDDEYPRPAFVIRIALTAPELRTTVPVAANALVESFSLARLDIVTSGATVYPAPGLTVNEVIVPAVPITAVPIATVDGFAVPVPRPMVTVGAEE